MPARVTARSDITAMETSLIGTFQLIVRKDMKLKLAAGRDSYALHHDGNS